MCTSPTCSSATVSLLNPAAADARALYDGSLSYAHSIMSSQSALPSSSSPSLSGVDPAASLGENSELHGKEKIAKLIEQKKEWKSALMFDSNGTVLGGTVTPLDGEMK